MSKRRSKGGNVPNHHAQSQQSQGDQGLLSQARSGLGSVTGWIPTGFTRSSSFGWFIAGAAFGSLITYMMDPVSGRQRVSYVRDQGVRLANESNRYVSRQARHLTNKARGLRQQTTETATT